MYGAPVWGNSSSAAFVTIINKMQDRALRITFNTDIITDTARRHASIHNFSETVTFQTVTHVHRVLAGNSGIGIPFTMLSHNNSTTRAAASRKRLVLKMQHKNCRSRFAYAAVIYWNNLPNNITSIINYSSFMMHARKFLFQ